MIIKKDKGKRKILWLLNKFSVFPTDISDGKKLAYDFGRPGFTIKVPIKGTFAQIQYKPGNHNVMDEHDLLPGRIILLRQIIFKTSDEVCLIDEAGQKIHTFIPDFLRAIEALPAVLIFSPKTEITFRPLSHGWLKCNQTGKRIKKGRTEAYRKANCRN